MKKVVIQEGVAIWVKDQAEFVNAMESWLGVKLKGSRRVMFEQMWDRELWTLCPDIVTE